MMDDGESPAKAAGTPTEEMVPPRCHVKHIAWNQGKVAIVLQNENGPCPLIAIANVLLLRGQLILPASMTSITTDRLVQRVAECVLEAIPKSGSARDTPNHQQNVQDAIDNLVGLSTGLNVNIKFCGVTKFEPTSELAIFDVLNIPLYHGWVVFSEPSAIRVVGDLSYNQLTEKMIADRFSGDAERVESALVAEEFLNSTASQMTYEGLCQLNVVMRPGELGVLFRNNHFSTILNHETGPYHSDKPSLDSAGLHPTRLELFLLVTDQGFLNEAKIVWETLTNIEGDGTFVDSNFKNTPLKEMDGNYRNSSAEAMKAQQIDRDFLVALSLQEEQKSTPVTGMKSGNWKENIKETGIMKPTYIITDAELARSLQEVEAKNAERDRQKGHTSVLNDFDPLTVCKDLVVPVKDGETPAKNQLAIAKKPKRSLVSLKEASTMMPPLKKVEVTVSRMVDAMSGPNSTLLVPPEDAAPDPPAVAVAAAPAELGEAAVPVEVSQSWNCAIL